MSPPIILNAKTYQNSPSQITRQSIITKVAKCALLLLALPVTLVLFAVMKGDLVRWVKGTPKTSDASRTPQECWQFIKTFYEEKRMSSIEMTESQLDALTKHQGFLQAVVECLENRAVNLEEKKAIVETVFDVYLGLSTLGREQKLLSSLERRIRLFKKEWELKEFLEECLTFFLYHGHAGFSSEFTLTDFPECGSEEDLEKYWDEYVKVLKSKSDDWNYCKFIEKFIFSTLAYRVLNFLKSDPIAINFFIKICKNVESAGGKRFSTEGPIETLFYEVDKAFLQHYDKDFFLTHYNGFREFLRTKQAEAS